MQDALISGFMKQAIHEEIIPTLTLPKQELEAFAEAVVERFSNPFIKHPLLSISLNSVSKFKARILPSIEQYVAARRAACPPASHSAWRPSSPSIVEPKSKTHALIGRRDGKEYRDQRRSADPGDLRRILAALRRLGGRLAELVDAVLGKQEWWGKDLHTIPGLETAVTRDLGCILDKGIKAALEQVTAADRRR